MIPNEVVIEEEKKQEETKPDDTGAVEAGEKKEADTAAAEETEVKGKEAEVKQESEKQPGVDTTPPEIKHTISKLKKSNRQLEIEKAKLQGRLEALSELKGSQATEKPKPVAVHDPSDPIPTQDQFETYEEFIDARSRWNYRQERAADNKKAAEEATKTKVNEIITRNQAKDPEFGEKLVEFVEETGGFTPTMTEVIQGNPAEADLIAHFVNNPDEYYRVKSLSPLQQAREIAKLEIQFSGKQPPASATAAPKRITTPPEPVSTLRPGASTAGFDPFDENASTEDRIAYWKAKRKT